MTVRARIDSIYRNSRGTDNGISPAVSEWDLSLFLIERLAQASRGVIRGLPGRFVSSGVRIRSRRLLRLGRGVALGRDVKLLALSTDGIRLEDSVTVDDHAVLRGSGGIRRVGKGIYIGARTAIGERNFIHGGGGVTIGQDCLLGPDVILISENHVFARADVPIRQQGEVGAMSLTEYGSK